MSNLSSLSFDGPSAVEIEDEGLRLDLWLSKQVGTRSKAQRMIKLGLVQVDQQICLSGKRPVSAGEWVCYQLPPSLPTNAKPVAYPLDVVYEDESVILINKPKGMVVHPSPGHFDDTLVNYLLSYWGETEADGLRPGIVHRIDKDTSGLLVIAKDTKSQESLSEQFRVHSITRVYRCLVWGDLSQRVGTIHKPLGRHPKERLRFAVRAGGKKATTHYKRLETFGKLSYIECQLETGRTHQIRVHLSHLGHPLVGDPLYGRYRDLSSIYPKSLVDCLKSFKGQALHARTLSFVHPRSGEWVSFEAPVPAEFASLLRLLREVTGEG